MTKLKLSGVSKAYGATLALRRGDLELDTGEVHVLIGANGSGKSTLCKIVAGSVRPDAGDVLLDGRAVTVSGPRAAQALGIGIFYQELSLADHRSVAENICLPDLPKQSGFFIDRAALREKAERYIALFEAVAGAELRADTNVGDLRADQRQLVEIMKALATEAPVLIFDEPTSALDRAQVDRFFEILRDLRNDGRSIVFISHRMDEIFAIGDRVTVIRDGETIDTMAIAETTPEAVIHMMVGEQEELAAPQQAAPPAQAASTDAALTVENLTGAGFRDVSFTVRRGEILGLGGLHGQGQSALLKALFGAPPPSAGEARIARERLRTDSPRSAIAQGVAYVSGDRSRDGVITGRPILENVTPIHALRNRLVLARPGQLAEKALPALKALNTKFAGLSHSIGSLSGGNQQKIVIARWLIDKPDILLLDDPTKGIDLSAKTDLFALIRRLAEEGLAIVLYSSEDAELLNNADRILVFNGGAVSRELSGAERTRYNLYQAAYEAA
ncbi:sugar ABC transporter ATP-binding protein [Nitratireductor aquimarinus]|uniref:sugar ABC transporter ATP-binding protein n=1 Tax=Alphaproteobacteria TaxID=28211 RepID=UPI0019D3CC3D|nr:MULTISPECIES: sugar ABC transporter ATP-binding protein [Alphaproteobacteria]MBN7755223.1 sugar ABC transporter ATP-binding protein [Nitratireductor aquimarinus]MBY5997977.1 sugar ABC transporter ATP-binding protein [Tritonibacter mobilis]MBY6020005.1 sugar ABC transporter ATP-binding protein [Nitratireductor sp. DP7N14-4]